MVASWLVGWTEDQTVFYHQNAGWGHYAVFFIFFSTKEYKWVWVNCSSNLSDAVGGTCNGLVYLLGGGGKE